MPLTTRAIVAVLLMIGFYVLSRDLLFLSTNHYPLSTDSKRWVPQTGVEHAFRRAVSS